MRSLLVVVLGSCAVLLLWTSVFMVNDDATMAAFASGDYTGHPSAHLVFVSAFLGLILSGLHSIAGPVPWFAYMLISIDVCSVACLIAIAYARRRQLLQRGQIAVVVLAAAVLPVVLLRPTFTVTAIIVCVTGLVMIAAATRSLSHARLLLWFGSICLGLGAMVRYESFVGVVAVFAPFIVLLVVHLGRRRALLGVCIVAMLVLGSSATDHVVNSSSGWSSFLEFNHALGPLIGNTDFERAIGKPADPAVATVLTNIGWNADDIELLNNWFFYDRNVYSTDHLSALASLTSGSKYNAPLSDSALLVFRSQRPLWILAVGLGITALASRRWRVWLLIFLQLTWSAAVFAVTAASQRFPDRVSIPMYIALGIILTLGIPLIVNETDATQDATPSRRAWPTTIIVAACLIAGFYLLFDDYAPWQISRHNQTTIATYHDQLHVLNGIDPAGRFICLGATLKIEGKEALTTTSGYRANNVLCTGWPALSPSFTERESLLGITPTMLDALATDTHVYLILGPSTVPTIQRLYLRYIGMNVTLDKVGDLANGAIVTRVRELTNSIPTPNRWGPRSDRSTATARGFPAN